jgi:hypothetical protein
LDISLTNRHGSQQAQISNTNGEKRERERLIKNVWTRLYLQRLAKVTRKKQTTTTAIHAMPYRLDKVIDREGARKIYRPND